jgi:hypothetical protein
VHVVNVTAARIGPLQRSERRQAVISRMITLMDEAKRLVEHYGLICSRVGAVRPEA